MLIGCHVSTAGGLAKAHERALARGCEAMQIFNQSPRMWRTPNYADDDTAAVRDRLAEGPIHSVVIHAVYLINCASRDPQVRRKSLDSLAHSVRLGDAVGADGVVLHAGSSKGESHEEAVALVGDALRHALVESDRCPILLENTAGAGWTLGRTFAELADLLEHGGGGARLGLCLDCCHLLASGYDVRTAAGLGQVLEECMARVGLDRLACLHVNDSKTPLGSNRDRHENLPEGELGREGLRAFLSEPRFEGLPALLEVPGFDQEGPDKRQVRIARQLREEGLRERRSGRGEASLPASGRRASPRGAGPSPSSRRAGDRHRAPRRG